MRLCARMLLRVLVPEIGDDGGVVVVRVGRAMVVSVVGSGSCGSHVSLIQGGDALRPLGPSWVFMEWQ